MTLGPIAFLAPWLLAALAVLPVLWWLLRAVPPAPARRRFPGVRLLLGLDDPERMPERTPWWLLALRMLALAAVILAFAGPVLNPREATGSGPLVVVVDGGWGDAPDWSARQNRIAAALDEANLDGRPVAILSLADPVPASDVEIPLRSASEWSERLAGIAPQAWAPDRLGWAGWIAALEADFETLWLSDGLDHGDGTAALTEALLDRGPVTLVEPLETPKAITPPRIAEGVLTVTALRADDGPAPLLLSAIGPDPNGVERVLGSAETVFEPGALTAEARFDLPVELRNRVARIQLSDGTSAAGVVLADDAVRRRKVGLMSGRAGSEAQDLNDPLNYLRKALEPHAELVEAPLGEMLNTAPDVIVLADVGGFADGERAALTAWVEAGGVLVRFAGPRLAQSGAGQTQADPLLPVRLRAGGRALGGAMSWGAPRQLQPFPETSPFAGLDVPSDVDIRAQVMAQPDPDLPQRVMASLEDGTPLVTGRALGEGRIVLFHVTADPDWSNLPLSGLFVQMLERLAQGAGGLGPAPDLVDDTIWTPVQVLDGFGNLQTPTLIAGVAGARLAEGVPSRDVPPGIYASGDRRTALNVMRAEDRLAPLPALPDGIVRGAMVEAQERPLGPWLLALGLVLLALDVIATLIVSGRLGAGLRAARPLASATVVALVVALSIGTGPANAQQEPADPDAEAAALYAANETVLAYVVTGDSRVDAVSRAGLDGLSRALFQRTAIEPSDPVAVDLETDPLALYPLLYWPVSEGQPLPSDEAYARLNEFMRHGGMIVFDTRDADLGASFTGETPNSRALQRLALRLDIPPLAQVPTDHVLTRTFYLLQDFPGRFYDSPVWVEASPETETVDGLPFRNLNDGVTPVVIGGNDWASAWAVQENGAPMFPIGRGLAGERQREMAIRFGINLVMHVMTGNYKSDQVHVPALLDRLGQ